MKKTEMPPLARYKPIRQWAPQYGDYIIWSGFFSVWHGVVTNFIEETNEVTVIFAGLPYLLFTMNEEQQIKETKRISLAKIKSSNKGTFAIIQHDYAQNTLIWHI